MKKGDPKAALNDPKGSILDRLIGGFALAFDFREPLEFVRVDLGDAMLNRRSVDVFGVLAIANLAIDADELALLESLRKA